MCGFSEFKYKGTEIEFRIGYRTSLSINGNELQEPTCEEHRDYLNIVKECFSKYTKEELLEIIGTILNKGEEAH